MKKAYLLIIVMAMFVASSWAVTITTTGRVLMETVYENNIDDWTDFDEDNAATTNDKDIFGRARVDLGFKAQITDNILARINTRFEGDHANQKWMYWGANNIEAGEQLGDAELTLQEAYIQYTGMMLPITWEIGRKTYVYGVSNIVGAADKLDGWHIVYNADAFYVNLHDVIRARNEHNDDGDYVVNSKLFGINGGTANDMMDINAYFWMQTTPETDDDKWSNMVFGARGEFVLMEGMVQPFVEFAMQSGTSDAADADFGGMLVDVGSKFDFELGSGNMDALVQFLMSSGQDADETDGTTFWGVGLSDNLQGYNEANVAAGGVQMIKIEAGFTPMAMQALRMYFDFWMFNDNSKNIDDVSGENIYNEFAVGTELTLNANANIYMGFNYLMPNEDMVGGEDAAMAFTFGTQVKW
ncbi:MAG: hypothetical protein K8R90_01830 [Candidatus Cloacimonetes bacterium]|nr:hypothetical protein [Candidatus Cloacimonadota bacterium]